MLQDQTDNHKHYMPALDGLRAVACMIVVASHIGLALQLDYMGHFRGSFGVLLFFALSGFLMGHLYLQKNCDRDNVAHYLISRFSRITPAYYIAIAFSAITALFVADQHYHMDAVALIKAYLFMGSTGVFWSISTEVQFYIFFVLIWLAYQRARAGQYALLVLVVLVSASFIATRDLWGGMMLPSKLHIFLFGVMAAFLVSHSQIKRLCGALWFQITAVAIVMIYCVNFPANEMTYENLALAGLIALLVMVFSASGTMTKFLEVDFMRAIGNASFSIYLLHDVLLRIFSKTIVSFGYSIYVNIFLCTLLTMAVPMVFYYLVERHLNRCVKEQAGKTYRLFAEKS